MVAGGMELCREGAETSEAPRRREAPVLNVLGPRVEHMLSHNGSHQNAGFLEARGQGCPLSGDRRGCHGLAVAGKVSGKRRVFRGGGNST